MAGGKRRAMVPLAARDYQAPDSKAGLVETLGCVSRRPPHLRVTSLGASDKWKLSSLNIENAFLQTDDLTFEGCPRSPPGRDLHVARRVWRLRTPLYGLHGAPATFCATLHVYPRGDGNSLRGRAILAAAALKFRASAFDPRLFFGYRVHGGAVRVLTTRTDGVLGRGDRYALQSVRR